MWSVVLHILPCCRLGRLQQFVRRLKVKTTVLCVQHAAEEGTYCVLAKARPTVSIFFTTEKTLSLSALLFGRDSSGNTTAHKVANRWLPVLVLPFPMPSSCSNAKMRVTYSAKCKWQPSVTSADAVQIANQRLEKLSGKFLLRSRTRCRLRIRFWLSGRHVDLHDCSHRIKMPVTLFGCIGKTLSGTTQIFNWNRLAIWSASTTM